MRRILLFIIAGLPFITRAQVKPTNAQLKWHEQEFYLFTHFGPNTFTNKEWGHGDEPEDIFNPTDFDAGQWCRTAKRTGATGIIITAKHHDGFCLWPSKYSTHTVRESRWKNGKGDVLRELADSCKAYGLKFGVYISPWDRNHPDYGTEKYNDVFVNMMEELFTQYGPIWELWWDGANGEGPNGKKQVYDWRRFEKAVRKWSPQTVVFSDIGPDIRWVGNENGIAGETNWNFLDTAGFTRGLGSPSTDTLNQGNRFGKHWIPAECDVSIRPGWFYHAEEDDKVKTPEQLFDLYLKSVGRGANLLLNVPPDRRGRFHKNDSLALEGFAALRKKTFATPIRQPVQGDRIHLRFDDISKIRFNQSEQSFEILNPRQNAIHTDFGGFVEARAVVLQELIAQGQKVSAFEVEIYDEKNQVHRFSGTTIGHKRILSFPPIKTNHIVLRILEADGIPVVKGPEVY